jgi:hypothetical protein
MLTFSIYKKAIIYYSSLVHIWWAVALLVDPASKDTLSIRAIHEIIPGYTIMCTVLFTSSFLPFIAMNIKHSLLGVLLLFPQQLILTQVAVWVMVNSFVAVSHGQMAQGIDYLFKVGFAFFHGWAIYIYHRDDG